MKILIWQTAFLGDLILSTPLIHSLKNLFPESSLSIITKPFGEQVLKNNPHIDKLIIFDKSKHSTIKLIKQLKSEKYDLAISPHRSHRASYSLFFARIPERIGFDKAGFSFLYTKTAKHTFDGTHEIDRNNRLLELLDNFDEKKVHKYPELYLTEEEDKYFENYNLKSKQYISIACGSKWKTKRWTKEGFSSLIEKLSKSEDIVLIGSSEDKQFVDEIVESLKSQPINLVGKTSLRQTFSIIKHSKLLISNDSAPVHMAVAFKTPVVDIYGPTVKDFGFYPYLNGIVVEPPKKLDCRPCGLHGHNTCPTGTFECMKSITVDMVLQAIKNIL